MSQASPLLEVDQLSFSYRLPRTRLFEPIDRRDVLHSVSLTLNKGEILGLVGESGCGKSTLARCILALDRPDSGHIRLNGQDLFALNKRGLRLARRSMQMIFQDPFGSLNPRHKVGRIVAEPLRALEPGMPSHVVSQRIEQALAEVGLDATAARRHPHAFSGGQRQRIAIARALIVRPALIVADEPVSALDVSVQAQVLNLMLDLQESLDIAFLLISHDLAVVRHVCDRIAIMDGGRIVETGRPDAVFDAPTAAISRRLVEAIPRPRFD